MDEDRFNIALRKFLKVVGITSERVVREDTMRIATSDAAGVSEKRNRGIDHGS
ncbi:MAG: DUF6494 family protein [Methylocella sp.]